MLSLLQKVLPGSARRSAGHAGVVLGEDSFALVLVRREGGGKPSIEHCRGVYGTPEFVRRDLVGVRVVG